MSARNIVRLRFAAVGGTKYTAAALTAFGEDISAPGTKHQAPSTFFTGKPEVAGLGHTFLFRNYRASLAKWQTADPLGYPDGWNQLSYCCNDCCNGFDFMGAAYSPSGLTDSELVSLYQALRRQTGVWAESYIVQWFSLAMNGLISAQLLNAFIYKKGDQHLPYSYISNQDIILEANQKAIAAILNGCDNFSYSFNKSRWNLVDLQTSLGDVVINYSKSTFDGHIVINASIVDPYDFHPPYNGEQICVQIFGLNWFWDGGDVVYDEWMRQLANKYGLGFNSTINWSIVIE